MSAAAASTVAPSIVVGTSSGGRSSSSSLPSPTPTTTTQQQQHHQPQARKPRSHILLAGFLAGLISRTATAPLDRLKVLMQDGRIVQFQCHHPTVQIIADAHRRKMSIAKLVRHLYHEGGLRSFWRGNGVNCFKAGPEMGLVFTVREMLSDAVNAVYPAEERSGLATGAVNFTTSAAAGAFAQSVLYPLEVVRTRMAVASTGEYTGFRDCVQQSYHRGGWREFYKGLGANMMGIMPYRGLEIGAFFSARTAWLKRRADDRAAAELASPGASHPSAQLGVMDVALLGMVSSIVAQTATYPINIVRTRLQTQGVNGRPVIYSGVMNCFSDILRKEGPVGLFSGLTANILKAVPASMITFVVVDIVTAALGK